VANNIKKWTCPEGAFVCNFSGHGAILNTLAVNAEGVCFSRGVSALCYVPWFSLFRYFFISLLLCFLHRLRASEVESEGAPS
jgi:hypothetical protein